MSDPLGLMGIVHWTPWEAIFFVFAVVASLRWADMIGAFVDDRISRGYEWLFRKNNSNEE
jgi:hypothetical protein